MIDQASVPSLMGSTVRDDAGEKIGKVGQVYLDDTTGQPEWVTVRTGLFGTKESFVPLAAARVEGDELVVEIPKSKVHDAPRIDEDGHLTEEQETELYTYYGVSQGPFGRQVTSTPGGAPDEGMVTGGPVADTYAGTETGRTGEGYPETDAGADYATAEGTGYPADRTGDAGYAAGGVPTGGMPTAAGMAAGTAAGAAAGAAAGRTGDTAADAPRFDDTGTPLGDRDVAVGRPYADPTGTPVGDQEVAAAMGGHGFTETDAVTGEEVGPDFARGEDGTVTGTGGGTSGGPDFARGEDASVTGPETGLGPDYARGTDRASRPAAGFETGTAGTAGVAGPAATGGVADPALAGGTADPTLADGSADPTLGGGAADPTLARGAGDPTLAGGPADPRLDSGAADPTLGGGAGDRTLGGGAGDRTLGGGAGDRAEGVDEPGGQGTGGVRRRLRRWLSPDQETSTPVVDESGGVVGEAGTRPADEEPR